MFADLIDYYLRWYHSKPVAITPGRRDELRRLHACLYKCAEHIAAHYMDYVPRWIPLSDKELSLLEYQSKYPFRAGTWRPDYIICRDGTLKICEITSRFFGHGIFLSWFAERAADRFMERFPDKKRETHYDELLEYLLKMVEGHRRIVVLKSADRTSAIKLYKRFFELNGHEVSVIESYETEARRREWEQGAFVISALNQADILSYSMDTLRAMADAGISADFRNTFLIHDKRFMQLWFEDSFTGACLDADETAFLRSHAIPTFDCSAPGNADIMEDARRHKDKYIVKPYRLGKSEGVHAGVLTSEDEWNALDLEGCILQPFLEQKTYPVDWEGHRYDDYLCGMMLCVDDRYFDSGMFRASSLPVTNVGDDRKACAIHTGDPEILSKCDVL